MESLWHKTFSIIKVDQRTMKYSARSWNEQSVRKYLLDYDGDRIIECSLIIHYLDQAICDLTIELSNMYNCVVGCRFCASGNLRKSVIKLKKEDYITQINTCLQESNINPNTYQNFYVSFYGIGEPSVVCNEIGSVMPIIKEKYAHAKFNIATFGFNSLCFDVWKRDYPYIRTLQIPFYSSKPNILKQIVRNLPESYNFSCILKKALEYKKIYESCRVKINYIVIQNINDSDEDVDDLLTILEPYLNDICIRISYLNYTKIGKSNGYYSSSAQRIDEINYRIGSRGFNCYIFGSEMNVEVGCGQLLQDYISSNEAEFSCIQSK